MKNTVTRILSLASAALFILGLAACDLSFLEKITPVDAVYAVSGRVVNAKAASTDDYWVNSANTDETLASAELSLVSERDGSSFSANADSAGQYSFADVPNGVYSLSARKDGWVFLPSMTVAISADSTALPDYVAFPAAQAGVVTVIMTWTNRETDMDLHMTYGGTLLNDDPDALAADGYSAGHVGYYQPSATYLQPDTSPAFTVTLDRDVTNETADPTNFDTSIPLVECVSVYEADGAPIIDPTPYVEGVQNAGDFRVYVNAFNKPNGTTGLIEGADTDVIPSGTTVHVFQDAVHLGSYYVPFNTAEKILRMAVIDMSGNATNAATSWTEIMSDSAVRAYGPVAAGLPVSTYE